MSIESYLSFQPSPTQAESPSGNNGNPSDSALEQLIHGKSDILGRKLDILAAEIWWRLSIGTQNLKHLADDQERVSDMLGRLDRDANYRLRDHQEKGVLYRRLFEIESEKRSEHVECWRDIVMVMRDFLEVWEAHEQSRQRSMFLENVGTGP